MSELVLLHPPASLPCEPPVGVSTLAGALRREGVQVTLIDANVEALHQLIEAVPESAAQTTEERRALRQRSRALHQLRCEEGYGDRDRHHSAVAALQRTLSLRSGRARADLADYRDTTASPLRRADLLRAAEDASASPYRHYFASLVARVVEERPRVVGLSINYLHQVLPAMTLAGMLRRTLPADVPVVAGGGLIRCWRRQLAPDALGPSIERLFFGAGERPLLALLGREQETKEQNPRKERGLGDGLPDFTNVRWPLYLAPRRVLPFSTSTGCYWKRCRYCPEAIEGERFRLLQSPLKQAFAQLAAQNEASLVHLTDSALPPTMLRQASELDGKLPWYGFARFHRDLTDLAFCQRLRRAGCVMLQLGLESGSREILRRLDKGIDLDEASRALRALHGAGVATYVYVMFGVPGENRAQAEMTLRFVVDHAPFIGFLNVSLLNLPHASPDEEGLRTSIKNEGADLSLYAAFEAEGSWRRSEARGFMDKVFAREPAIATILRRSPYLFGASHAAFFALES